MSRRTNFDNEPSVSCGFYNSINDDRTYHAKEMSAIFDGVITDGIFASIGTCLVVRATTGNIVNVGAGKAWFNHTWTLNDAVLQVTCPDANSYYDRIDAIILRINTNDDIRDNFIMCKKGTEATSPVRPTMQQSDGIYEYPLCYIYRAAGSTEIIQSNITNMVGTAETPFVTGILQTVSLDQLLTQWQDELDRFVAAEKARATKEIDSFIDNSEADFDEWYEQMKTLMADAVNEVDVWTENQKNIILDWFDHMKDQLSEDAAINIQLQIDAATIERTLVYGFLNGQKTFSEDGTVITSVDSSGQKLVKRFTPNFDAVTTVLTNVHDVEIGRLIKTFSSDGRTISSELIIN